MRLITFLCTMLTLLPVQGAGGAQKSITYYLDGARIEQEAVAQRGYLEQPLPESFQPGSLRVRPLGRGSVLRVELVPADRDPSRERKVAQLEERKRGLQAKLQELEELEAIFAAAARSQSGRAPRKSKANPEPLTSLEQGTDFALGRLEGLHRKQRRVLGELNSLERELSAARKGSSLARVWLSGRRALISYLVSDRHWAPCYDLRLSGVGSTGELQLHARLPQSGRGVLQFISRGSAAEGIAARAVSGDFPLLARYPLSLRGATAPQAPAPTLSFDPVEAGLPPGEGALYWRGEYLGSGRFAGGGASEFSLAR